MANLRQEKADDASIKGNFADLQVHDEQLSRLGLIVIQ